MPDPEQMTHQKVRVAGLSAIAALGLVTAKAIVGWETGSLGILSEAAHSAMDFIATVITFLAVRVADRPADQEHHYGHGKVENLSALVETGLLLVTCLWIIYEALERLLFKPVEVEPSWAAFAVVGGSMAVDWWRSRALARMAELTGSQALEADALNFRTDIWGSSTVLVGLAGVWAAQRWHLPGLALADAVAGILVAALVFVVGGRMGKRAVDALLDRAPEGLVDRVRAAVESVPEIQPPVSLRVRRAGPQVFVDAAVSIARNTSFEHAHAAVTEVEERVREVAPDASIVIHAEPLRLPEESLGDAVRVIATRYAAGAHDMLIYEADGRRAVDLHLELPEEMRLTEADAITRKIEEELRRDFPRLGLIRIHVDPAVRRDRQDPGVDLAALRQRLAALAQAIPGIRALTEVSARRTRAGLWVICHCRMDPRLSVREAHDLGRELARRAQREVAGLDRMTVHAAAAPHA